MLNQASIRKKMIIAVLLSCIIPYVIGAIYIKNTTEDWLYQSYITHANMMLETTAKNVDDSILRLMSNLSLMMSQDARILQSKDSLSTYLDYNSGDALPVKSADELAIAAYLKTIKDSQPILTLVSFGTESGGYVEVPEFKPSKAYDPRVRPWYKNAMFTDKPYFSEPYQTKITDELVFAISKSVIVGQAKIGVVSLTLKLEDLMTEINKQYSSNEGYINILSPNNLFINSPMDTELLLTSTDDLEEPIFSNLAPYHGQYFEGVIDGEPSIFSVYISPYSGWQYVSIVKRADVLKQSTVLTGIFMLIYAITLIIMIILIYLISTYITRPILHIAHVIHEMADFKFDQYHSHDFEIYTHLGDEIGEMTRAMHRMQANYVELNQNIQQMDEEIKTIDVQQHSDYKIKFSNGNPFAIMMSSINGLLERVHKYVDQIKGFNLEMTEKNELLVASEEELTAQLEEIESQKEVIRFLAEHDPLTDLPNRRMFDEQLSKRLSSGRSGSVIMMDLDNFKGINDTLGHIFGDKVLKLIGKKLKATASDYTFVSRFGGDEFLIALDNEDSSYDVFSYIQTLQDTFNKRFLIDDHEISIEFSIGITRFPEDNTDANQLIMNADLALYHIKNSGKNNHAFFTQSMSDHQIAKRVIKESLRDALENDGFKLVYQPQVELNTGRILSYEALLRLKNNQFGPGDFIPVAEEDNMIIIIGRRVTEMAIKQIAIWRQHGYSPRNVSINFSAQQTHDRDYKQFLFDCLTLHKVAPELITIEITENSLLENKDSTIRLLNELRNHGLKIAIDDFGTGYSSLSYLTELPIDLIKLDRTLCTRFLELENIAVMDSLIGLAHSLNLKVVAEGIEHHEQVRRLTVGKCDVVQGYYFSRPLEVADVEMQYNRVFEI
jgi:diguanylate cyclase (GGDEF)-like protein